MWENVNLDLPHVKFCSQNGNGTLSIKLFVYMYHVQQNTEYKLLCTPFKGKENMLELWPSVAKSTVFPRNWAT